MKPVVIIASVIAASIIGTYYRQMDKRGQDYNPVGPMIFAAVMIAITVWVLKTPP